MAVGRAEITVVADASEFDRQMRRMADSMTRAFRAARTEGTRSFSDTEAAGRRLRNTLGGIQGGLGRVRERLAAAAGSASGFRDATAGLAASLLRTIGSIRRISTETELWRDENGRLHDSLGRFVAEQERGWGGLSISFRGAARVFGRTASAMGRIAAVGAGVGAAAGAVGVLAANTLALGAALAPAVGILAAAPAVIGVAGAAISTLAVALNGVGEAFGAAATGDAEEFAAALEGLAPSAAAAATALREIAPVFGALRESVQQAFFEGFDQVLLDIGATLAGPLEEGMTAAASATGGLVQRLGEVATSASGVAFVESSFAGLANAVANLTDPLARLFDAFLEVGTAVNVAFGGEAAAAGLAGMIDRFAAFLSAAAESGEAVGWVEGAMTVFGQLGAILGPVIGILGSLGQAAADSGGDILGALGQALGAVDSFLSSAEGMAAMSEVFGLLSEVGAAFGEVLSGLLPVIVPLVGELVSGMLPVLQALVPVIVQIGELAAPLFVQILDAVLPLVPPLLGLVSQILPLLATVLSNVVTAAAPLLEVLVTLLINVLAPLLTALEPLIISLSELSITISEILVPVVQLLGDILLWLVETIIVPVVVPILEFLIEIFSELLVAAVQFFADFLRVTVDLIVAIAFGLREDWRTVTRALRTAWETTTDAFAAGARFIRERVFDPLKSAARGVRDTFKGVWRSVRGAFDDVVDKFQNGADKIVDAFDGIFDGIKGAYNALASGWNSIDISIGPFTIPDWVPVFGGNTFHIPDIIPDIPRLQTSGFSFGTGLVEVHPNEAIVNARDPRGIRMLADAIDVAGGTGGGIVIESGAVVIQFTGAAPDPETARAVGEAAGNGLMRTLAERRTRMAVRTL